MSVEQRIAIKFCVLNGKNRKETTKMLVKAYGDAAMKRTALHKWSSRYKNGYESVVDEQRSRRPSSITSQKAQEIKELLDKDRRITVREVSQQVDCSVGTVHTIIHESLDMSRLCARRIPKMLSECQKAQRVESCLVLFSREDFPSRIVTADETWISLYEPESKEQSTIRKTPVSPSPKKFKVSCSTKKQMFIMFFDIHVVILSHAVLQGQTVTANYYSTVSLKLNNVKIYFNMETIDNMFNRSLATCMVYISYQQVGTEQRPPSSHAEETSASVGDHAVSS